MSGPIATLFPADKPRHLPWYRRWRTVLLWMRSLGLIFLVGGWFFLNSALYFRGIILPRLEETLRARITAQHIGWSFLSGVTLRGLVVQTTGKVPVFTAGELRLHMRAGESGKGPIISQLHLVDPVLNVVVADDGTNLIKMEEHLTTRIKGQDYGIEVISKELRSARAGLKAEEQPLGVFLLVGPSGVGKSSVARRLAGAASGG